VHRQTSSLPNAAPVDPLGAPWMSQAGPDLANIYHRGRFQVGPLEAGLRATGLLWMCEKRRCVSVPLMLLLSAATGLASPLTAVQWAVPHGWAVFGGPPSADQWLCAAFRPPLRVELTDGLVQIEESRAVDLSGVAPRGEPATPAGEMGRRSALHVGSSWLVALDRGEHGGSLWLVDESGKETRLGEEPGRALFRLKRHVALLVGPTHRGGRDTGAILLFDPSNLKAKPVRIETRGLPTVGVRTAQGGLTFATRVGVFQLQSEAFSPRCSPLDHRGRDRSQPRAEDEDRW
jgi:hypothetical protein